MITLKQGLKLSAIIDKLDIKIKDPNGTPAQVGADLMMQIISKAHKAEEEIYAFVAEVKGISIKEAEEINLIDFINEIGQNKDIAVFFKSAVK